MPNARWSTAVAAAALIALPVVAAAQSTQAPPQKPPAQQQSQPPDTPPSAQPPAGQVDATAAKQHLTEARNTLAALTALPEAAKLQGEPRNQVAQLISNFNALITTQSEWRAAYAKVDDNLTALLGPNTAPDQPVGTSGNGSIDPAIRAKLTEFRTHLKAFEAAAGGAGAAAAEGAMPPSAPTPTTTNPANPATPPANPATPTTPPANPATPPAAAANPPANPSVSPSSPTATMDPADRAKASNDVSAAGNADAQKELDAISAILGGSKTGALTKAQTAELRKHVEILRALLAQR